MVNRAGEHVATPGCNECVDFGRWSLSSGRKSSFTVQRASLFLSRGGTKEFSNHTNPKDPREKSTSRVNETAHSAVSLNQRPCGSE